jgi:hypothetical protein
MSDRGSHQSLTALTDATATGSNLFIGSLLVLALIISVILSLVLNRGSG